jgi:hypothetical protein
MQRGRHRLLHLRWCVRAAALDLALGRGRQRATVQAVRLHLGLLQGLDFGLALAQLLLGHVVHSLQIRDALSRAVHAMRGLAHRGRGARELSGAEVLILLVLLLAKEAAALEVHILPWHHKKYG